MSENAGMDIDDEAFGWAVSMRTMIAKPTPIAAQEEDEPREPGAGEKEDRRFNQHGRIGKRPMYTFECGYGEVPVEDPWPYWVQRNPDGTVTVDFNSKEAQFGQNFPGVDFSEHKVFPYPWGNENLRKSLTQPQLINKLYNIIAGMPMVPFFMFRPPLWLMLNGVGIGKELFVTHKMSPVAISSQIIFSYLQVIHSLEGSTHAYTAAQIGKINAAHTVDVKKLTETIHKKIGDNAAFKELTSKMSTDFSSTTEEERAGLDDFARFMVTFTLNYIKLLERKIYRLADEKIKPDDLVNSDYVEFALPDPRNPKFTPWFDKHTDVMHKEILLYIKLKFEIEELKLPAEPVLHPANSMMGISYPALKLLMYCLYRGV